ncbi:MAG: endonuclease domain-containing protein [Gammaproteobacteria bacterium]
MIKNKIMITRARHLRKNFTEAEDYLWRFLKNRLLQGYKFRRQQVVGTYILDFVCEKKKLVIELDGSQHVENHEYDEKRTRYLNEKRYTVLRFWNDSVFLEIESVLEVILDALGPHPNPLPL